MNELHYGDCLTVMQGLADRSIDLIYLDPPFNSNRSYNAIYKDGTGRPLPDQIDAFCDTWVLSEDRERAIRTMPVLMRENGIDDDVVEFWRLWMNALRNSQPRLLAYLSYMVERLIVMFRLMKPTASLYLHCDPTASHYIKILLDAIFGHQYFQNEVIWHYRGGGVSKKRWGRRHDVLLFYTKGKKWQFNVDDVREPYSEETLKRLKYKARSFRGDKVYDTYEPNPLGKHPDDVWHMQPIMPSSKERIGYATQKPIALLERIIKASSNPGDTVLDPFCGCATTLEAAQHLDRRWIGIDVAIHAIKRVAQVRLEGRCGLVEGEHFVVKGIPRTLEGAQHLWKRDKYQFQKWAVEHVEGFCTTKRSADGGIDGRIYFDMPGERDLQSMVLEVKGGKHVNIQALRALRGVLDAGDAQMAGLIVMEPLGERQQRNFGQFMAQAGDLEVNGFPYPRMQMLSVKEMLEEDKQFFLPNIAGRREPRPRLIPIQPGA